MASSSGSSPTRAGDRRYEVTFDPGEDASVSVSVVEAIASVEGVEPGSVDFHLDDYVDADALDSLVRHATTRPDAGWTVEFAVDEYVVTVGSDGRITVS